MTRKQYKDSALIASMVGDKPPKKRRISKAGRAAISKAQKARWAKHKEVHVHPDDKVILHLDHKPLVSMHDIEVNKKEFDNRKEAVNHPAHYGGDTAYEVIKVLEAWGLDKSFCLGNSVKYIARAKQKTPTLKGIIEDLEKAAWYLNREIMNLKAVQTNISGSVK